jgi:hypothetical protein
MAYVLNHIGVQDKRLTEVKSMSGTMKWRCTDGRLLEEGVQSCQFRLTAMDTLAVANLLFDNYTDIVRIAREEQRVYEEENMTRGHRAEIPWR